MSTTALFLLAELPVGQRFTLDGPEGRHAARARRIGLGERIRVGDGAGSVAECVVTAVGAEALELEVERRSAVPAPQPRLVVVQALPKGERAELAVEILTELGADEIVPWAAARSIVHWSGARGEKALQKWRRTAWEAAKQSRRAWVPAVGELASTTQVAARLAGAAGIVLHESAGCALTALPLPPGGAGEVLVVVGPEGGIAEDELAAFTAAGALLARLGDPVLRTSTAGAAALAVLSARLGRCS